MENLSIRTAMNETSFALLLGGSLSVTSRVREWVAGCRVIAADNGMRHAQSLGVVPELWVGDFDSAPSDLLGTWPDVERQPYPARKAVTDGEIAASEAIARGATRLVMIGALGGERSDHALQHLVLALALAAQGLEVVMTSGEEEAWPLLADGLALDLPAGCLFSVIGLSSLAGLTIGGARYPLENFDLPFGSSRTVSNVAEGPVAFSLRAGRAVVLARPHDFSGA